MYGCLTHINLVDVVFGRTHVLVSALSELRRRLSQVLRLSAERDHESAVYVHGVRKNMS